MSCANCFTVKGAGMIILLLTDSQNVLCKPFSNVKSLVSSQAGSWAWGYVGGNKRQKRGQIEAGSVAEGARLGELVTGNCSGMTDHCSYSYPPICLFSPFWSVREQGFWGLLWETLSVCSGNSYKWGRDQSRLKKGKKNLEHDVIGKRAQTASSPSSMRLVLRARSESARKLLEHAKPANSSAP